MLSSIDLHITTTPLPIETLSPEEVKHLKAYSHESARTQALLGMALRRKVLGSGVASLPAYMSLSHTQGLAVLAVHPEAHQCLGVDVECCRRKAPSPKTIQWLGLDDTEKAMIQQLPPLGVWCVKEALWKAWRFNANTVVKTVRILELTLDEVGDFTGEAQTPTGEKLSWSLRRLEKAGVSYYLALATSHK